MSNENTQTKVPVKKIGLLPKLGIACGALVVLALVAYFVLTSAWFLKSVILPKAGATLHARITLEDASLSPFSSVTLTRLRVIPEGADMLLTAEEARLRYSLMDMIRGRINIAEISLNAPVVQVIYAADGTSNLDPILKAMAAAPTTKPAEKAKSTQPLQLDLKKFVLNNATVRYVQKLKTGGQQVTEITGLTLTADDLANNRTGRLSLAAGAKFDQGLSGPTNGVLTAQMGGNLELALDASLMPGSIKGNLKLDLSQAAGAFKDAAGLGATLETDLSPQEIKTAVLKFSQAGKSLGLVRVSGPFDAAKREAKLRAEVVGIDRQVLNLAGAMFGGDFNSTTLNSSNQIEIAQAGQQITVNGSVAVRQFSLTRQGQTTPVMDLGTAYNVTVDQKAKNAQLQSFLLTATQNAKEILRGTLAKPMKVDWGNTANAVDESALELTVSGLNLADWRAFAADYAPAGQLNARLSLLSQRAGKKLLLTLTSSLNQFAGKYGSNQIAGADLALQFQTLVEDFHAVTLSNLTASIASQQTPMVDLTANGTLDATTKDTDLRTTAGVVLPRLAALLGNPDLKFDHGTLRWEGRISQKNTTPNLTTNALLERGLSGALRLENLTGLFKTFRFDRFETAADFEVTVKPPLARINRATATLRQAGQAGGTMELSGSYNLAETNGQMVVKVTDLNQNALRGFVAAALGSNILNSVALNADFTASYNPKGDSGARGTMQVANLLITDPAGRLPRTPLTAGAALDVGMKDQLVSFRQCNGDIKMGALTGGSFGLAGRLDLAKTNGQFSLGLTNLNQNALAPFLSSALGDRQLTSIAINATAEAGLDVGFAATVKSDLSVTNLVLKDPSGALPSTPLALGANLEAAFAKSVLDLRKLLVSLTPTARASNQMQLAGRVDMTTSNATTGTLALTSAGLDFTHYYEIFGAPATNPPAPATHPATATNSAPAPVEPDPMPLLLRQFEFSTKIAALYLQDVAISNLIQTTKIDGGRIAVEPCQLTLNGAPLSAKLLFDLGVKGWTYDVSFLADQIPVAPLARLRGYGTHGEIQGFMLADGGLKGAGITPPSLQSNLTGKLNFAITNAAIQMNTADAAQSAKSFFGSLAGTLGGVLKPIGTALGVPDVMKSPLTLVVARAEIGQGRVNLLQAGAESAIFRANAVGAITLGNPIPDSRYNDIPLEIALERGAAIKARLASSSTPTNQTYVILPNFVTLAGTLGKQDIQIKKTVIAGLIGKSVIGFVPQAGEAAGGALKSVAGFLTGEKKTADTNTVQTTNTESGTGLLNKLGGLFGGNKSVPQTNPPPSTPTTNSAGGTNPPAQPPAKRGLFDFLK